MKDFVTGMLQDARRCWWTLLVTDLTYKILAFVLLTPLAALLFRTLLRLSGRSVMADTDLVYFFAAPLGWICLVSIGAIWLTIVALEMSALLAVLATARSEGSTLPARTALAYAAGHALTVLRVTARMLVWLLLCLAPFLVVALVVYEGLLTDYDINYYLKEKPPEFIAALGIGVVLLTGVVVVMVRLISSWFFALPTVLFEGVATKRALKESHDRSLGNRKTILFWLLAWAALSFLVTFLLTASVVFLGHWLVSMAIGRLPVLIVVIGLMLCLWFLSTLIGNWLSTVAFAVLLMNLYRDLACRVDLDSHSLFDSLAAKTGPAIRLNRLGWIVTIGTAVLLAAFVGVIALQSVQLEDRVEIIAHRGSSAVAPENTLAAISQAIEDDADWVEIDVQETADDQVVVLHDSDFMKLAGNNLKIWDASVEDLQDIDIGSWFGPEFHAERVPTLAQVLALCRGKIKVDIELKYYGHDKQLERRTIEVVDAYGMTDQVMYMSLKLDAVEKMKALQPDCTAGLLMSVSAGNLKDIPADFLAVNASFVDFWFVRSAHSLGKQVFVWTVNDPLLMSNMISMGVDGLITDRPDVAREVLRQRESLGTIPRALLQLASVFGVKPKPAEQ